MASVPAQQLFIPGFNSSSFSNVMYVWLLTQPVLLALSLSFSTAAICGKVMLLPASKRL
jgi:hypothetical protein